MVESRAVEYLTHFGLSRQEALVYEQLLAHGKQTGYEIARDTGISRSNAYTSLAALVEKGAAYLVEESAKKYIPVCPEEFCGNRIRRMQEEQDWLAENLPRGASEAEGYITVDREENIRDRICNLLDKAEERVYFSCSAVCLEQFRDKLSAMAEDGKKIVLITDRPFSIQGAIIYLTENRGEQIGLITDSKYVLSGEFGQGSMNTCLYSGQKNFVRLFKTAMANEIELIKIRKGER
ncbi:MAG TPA: TrmB family transcriptional regulator [Candidatus Mediterraneibacter merdavium]|nr:TrmB family transcriptional regulator [Candidatus Mediterraneibacter merdavium]